MHIRRLDETEVYKQSSPFTKYSILKHRNFVSPFIRLNIKNKNLPKLPFP